MRPAPSVVRSPHASRLSWPASPHARRRLRPAGPQGRQRPRPPPRSLPSAPPIPLARSARSPPPRGAMTGAGRPAPRQRTESTRELVLKYFHSWQRPADFDEMAACFSDDAEIDLGAATLRGGAAFRRAVGGGESPWLAISLLDTVFSDGEAALVYEGVEEASGVKLRVAELLTVEGGKIVRMRATFCQVGVEARGEAGGPA
eukprot:evm.model.scf_1192EXC.4 EVM.evm.TU.scf_1192EXC.4   scf_1192EXC:26918-27523(+)